MSADLKYRVTVDAVIRFEERASVDLFAALATEVSSKDDDTGTRAVDIVKTVFRNSLCLSAFIYECGLTEKDRAKTSFDDWIRDLHFADILEQYDACILALFLSSPSQTSKETGEKTEMEKKAEVEVEAVAEVPE